MELCVVNDMFSTTTCTGEIPANCPSCFAEGENFFWIFSHNRPFFFYRRIKNQLTPPCFWEITGRGLLYSQNEST